MFDKCLKTQYEVSHLWFTKNLSFKVKTLSSELFVLHELYKTLLN